MTESFLSKWTKVIETMKPETPMTTTTAPVEALKPCPLCSGEPGLTCDGGAYVYCQSCGMKTGHYSFTKPEEAIAAWNRRALTASPATDVWRLVEALLDAVAIFESIGYVDAASRARQAAEAVTQPVQKPPQSPATDEMREALEPFATFAEGNVDERGWTDIAVKNDRIVCWFGPSDFRRARDAYSTIPAPQPVQEMHELPADVVELVIAARIVAFEDQSPEALRALDKASEAFADRVPWENEPEPTPELPGPATDESFQSRVHKWLLACFGEEIAADKLERGDRLLEEVMELLQSNSYPRERIRALEDYVYARPAGEPHQEVGGVVVTLAAYCSAHSLDLHKAAEDELARIWTKVEKIRAKQAAKPTGSALPVAAPVPATDDIGRLVEIAWDKALNTWLANSRHSTKQEADNAAIKVLLDAYNTALLSQQSEINRLREALKILVDRHGAHIEALPGESGLADLSRARAALPKAEPNAKRDAVLAVITDWTAPFEVADLVGCTGRSDLILGALRQLVDEGYAECSEINNTYRALPKAST